jgi:ORF6N domain
MDIQIIQQKIHQIRGQKIMFDFDLADFYDIETKRLKEAVRRNIERFPPDFMFELSDSEFEDLRTQNASSSWGGTRYVPFAFTELGVAMLSSVLRSDKAVQTNIAIMRAFVAMRRFALSYSDLSERLNGFERVIRDLALTENAHYEELRTAIDEMLNDKNEWESRTRIGYKKE